jgi:type VI secretion system secreted protein VgrG
LPCGNPRVGYPAAAKEEASMAADGTLMTMTSPLGAGVLQPIALQGEEAISAPFVFHVQMVSTQEGIDPDSILFQAACVTVERKNTDPRHFHGIVRSFSAGEKRDGTNIYHAELVPKWWFASQTRDCRVFHKMSIADILQTLFTENGVSGVKTKINGAKTQRAFVVQFNETDFEFAARLMEAEGYFYFFEHTDSAHNMVLTDNNSAFTALAHPEVELMTKGGGINGLNAWHRVAATAVGKVTLQDYDPLAPSTPVTDNQATVLATGGHAARDVFEWPALTTKAAEAKARARIREEAAEAFWTLFEGAGQDQEFVPGGKFTLKAGPQVTGDAGEYVIRSVFHEAVDEVHGSGGGGSGYSNRFTAFPSATVWRQPIVVPRPHLGGIYSAVVLGPEGEEIYTDPDGHGMIKVRFHWDHRNDATADNTIWLRVMQPWSGAGWGVQHIPRVGTEVAVAFVNGDLDCPIVIGCYYNANQMHPLALPGDKTKSGFRTRSSPKGGTANFSEFWIDDKKGSEMVFLHAEKDHSEEVENDQTVHVMHDQKITVDHDRTRLVKNDETVTIEGKQTITVTKDRTVEISQGNESLTVKTGNMTTEVSKGDQKNTVKMGDLTNEVSMGNMSNTVKMGNLTTNVDMGNISETAKLGNITVKANLGAISMEAMQSIELKVGQSSVKIDQMGVTIKGMMVKIEGQVMTDVKGLMTTVTGSAMNQVKGGIVMIGP